MKYNFTLIVAFALATFTATSAFAIGHSRCGNVTLNSSNVSLDEAIQKGLYERVIEKAYGQVCWHTGPGDSVGIMSISAENFINLGMNFDLYPYESVVKFGIATEVSDGSRIYCEAKEADNKLASTSTDPRCNTVIERINKNKDGRMDRIIRFANKLKALSTSIREQLNVDRKAKSDRISRDRFDFDGVTLNDLKALLWSK